MKIDRLRKIIEYSKSNRTDMERKVKKFYSYTGIGSEKDVLNILQIVRPALRRRGYLVLEMPFADDEIGALCYKGDALGYILINTSLPKVNSNFAICHEVYHVYYNQNEYGSKVEFANDLYFQHEDEYAANLFAGMLLMPEMSFREMYHIFKSESNGNEKQTVIQLMNYYQVPYMAALIRCYELELPESNTLTEELIDNDREQIRKAFVDLWLDDSILDATEKDDYDHLWAIVEKFGNEYVDGGYLNEKTLKKVLRNMRTLYLEIKGE